VLCRGLAQKVPVYLTHLTAPTIDWGATRPPIEAFQAGARIDLGDLAIQSFTIPHDAVDPVAYTIETAGVKLSIVTDLGYLPDSVKYHLRDTHFLLLESNHHPELLKVGPYPWHIKQRILSRKGHLSNQAACAYISQELPENVHTLLLGHLSEQNNNVWETELGAKQALAERGCTARLVVLEPRRQSELFQL
jgi:phosphoribosyl 1,2-cyclic phosphodiesterase